jgi:hypothetical protein
MSSKAQLSAARTMSRLDQFIRRITAQRDCLNFAAPALAALPGPVLELGLGNGRTYDHLRALLPEREIFVFDWEVATHPDCLPDDAHMIVGDFRATLPGCLTRIGAPAALVHADFGSPDRARDAELAAWLAPALMPLVRPGGLVLTDRPLPVPSSWVALALPQGLAVGDYFMYRAG